MRFVKNCRVTMHIMFKNEMDGSSLGLNVLLKKFDIFHMSWSVM